MGLFLLIGAGSALSKAFEVSGLSLEIGEDLLLEREKMGEFIGFAAKLGRNPWRTGRFKLETDHLKLAPRQRAADSLPLGVFQFFCMLIAALMPLGQLLVTGRKRGSTHERMGNQGLLTVFDDIFNGFGQA